MDQDLNVALVRSELRREAFAECFALIVDDLRAQITPTVVVVAQPACHADALSATLDAVLHAGAIEVVVVESATTSIRQAHRREAFGRPVRFVDPDDAETRDLLGVIAGVSCTISVCHVSKRRRLRREDALLPWSSAGSGDPGRPHVSDRALALPNVLVVDAFDAKRTVLAGTDVTAVEAVTAWALGERREWNGTQIRVLGDPIAPAGLVRPGRLHAGSRSRTRARQDRLARP